MTAADNRTSPAQGLTQDAGSGAVADAPVAARRPHTIASPHGERTDPYYWLRDDERQDGEVLAYLRAENAYKDRVLAPLKPLEDALYEEIIGRLKQDDATVPYRKHGHWYYARYEPGKEHPIFARRKLVLDAPEHEYYQIGALEVSPDAEWLAFSEDIVGQRRYRLRLKNIFSGEMLADA